MEHILRCKVTHISTVGYVSRLRKVDVAWTEEALSGAMILIQNEGLKLSCIAVEASDLHKVAWDYSCRGVGEDLFNQIGGETVDDSWM